MLIITDPHPTEEYSFGWAPPPVADPRNYKLEFDTEAVKVPVKASVETQLPACWNQGRLGSCTSFSANAGRWQVIQKEFDAGMPGIEAPFYPSFLFEYWNIRVAQGTENRDSGGTIQGSYKAMAKYGICLDTEWPYDISKYNVKPPEQAFTHGVTHKFLQYFDVGSSLNNLKACIAAGYGFSFGFIVKSSFTKADGVSKDGIMRKAGFFERTLGGHAVYAIAYDDNFQTHEKRPGAFLIRNSWGTAWGPFGGNFWMPYNVMDSDATDEFFSPRVAA